MAQVEALGIDEINTWLGYNPDWYYMGDALHFEHKFKNFKEAFAFLAKLAEIMEEQNHHAEIYNMYATVRLSLTTHDAGNKVSAKDLALAGAVEELLEKNK